MLPSSQLYQPLETALQKSMVRDPNLQITREIAYQTLGNTSRISKRMRSLSPQQASYIRSSTFRPADKVLVPTDHLWRVKDKRFSAVNIQVKQGQPIPANLMRIPPTGSPGQITYQTVYEAVPVKSEIRSLSNTRSITNLRTVFPPPSSQQILTAVPTVTKTVIQRPASPVRFISRPATFTPSTEYQIKKIEPINSLSRANVNSVNMQTLQPNQTSIINTSKINQQITESAPNQYDSYERQNYAFGNQKSKKSNALDEAVNTQCGSCGGNEIIASKPMSSWE